MDPCHDAHIFEGCLQQVPSELKYAESTLKEAVGQPLKSLDNHETIQITSGTMSRETDMFLLQSYPTDINQSKTVENNTVEKGNNPQKQQLDACKSLDQNQNSNAEAKSTPVTFKDSLLQGIKSVQTKVKDVYLEKPKKSAAFGEDGNPTVTFSYEEADLYCDCDELQYSLIGKFSFGFPRILDIVKEFRKFKMKGEFHIGYINAKNVFIQMQNEEDFISILTFS